MKIKNIFPLLALASLSIMSCEDQMMDWHKDASHGEVTVAELPLPLAEQINRYDFLKNYTDFKLGVGIGLDLYMNDASYQQITNENFDEVTVGYAMKHGPMVNSKGEINFTAVDAFIAKTKEAGLSTFGHTLVWHTNQNASYLNGLIAPTIIPGAAGSNLIDLSGLQDGSFTGWDIKNAGDGVTLVDGEGLTPSSKAIKLIAGAGAANAWDLQLATPSIIVDATHNHEVSFYIKSDQPGKGRISFDGLNNNYPWMDWMGTGSASEAFETTSQWQQVKFTTNDFIDNSFQMNFDLGYLPSVTYYMDVNSISVVDLDAEPTIQNLVTNGTFDENMDGWNVTNGGDAFSIASEAEAFSGTGALKVVNVNDIPTDQWRTQIQTDFTHLWEAGKTYTISLWVRSEATGGFRLSTTNQDEANYTDCHYLPDETTNSTWKQFTYEVEGVGYESGLSIDIGGVPGTYYIDDILVTDGTSGSSGPIIIEKTDAEKAQLIGDAMQDWISKMVGHYKNDITAWDVVNEPMRESGEIRDGNVSDPADDEFYWVKYLGKDYAVTAFKLARQYGNATDILFINDYNLEYSLDKCQGLIDYVSYIEGKGAQVDGIGTQMHISIDSDTTKMIQMFQKLATSGKLIKISELDVRMGTNAPTAEQLEQQANMYRFVLDAYTKYIPESQRYGVTAWGISDNAKEHEYWLPDESPNLWDANYQRKHAYKGFANGLAGRDVSTEFSGELVY